MSFIAFLDTVLLQRPVVNMGTDRFNISYVFYKKKSSFIFPKNSQQINFLRNTNRLILYRTRAVFFVRYELSFYSYVIQIDYNFNTT